LKFLECLLYILVNHVYYYLHEILSDTSKISFLRCSVDIVLLLGLIYVCFFEVLNWVSISLWILYLIIFGGKMVSIPFSSSHHSCLYCVTVLDRLVGGFSRLFFFPSLNFLLWLYWVFSFCPWFGCYFVLTNSQW
jgi:hypothetical protein